MASIGPRPSAPITGAVTRNQVITASGRTPSPRTDTASSSVHERPRGEQRPGARARCPAGARRRREVVADVPRRHQAGDGRRPRTRGRASARPGARSRAAPLTAPLSLELERRVALREGRRRGRGPRRPRLSHAPSAWTGITKTAVSPRIVAGRPLAGSRSRRRGCRTPSSGPAAAGAGPAPSARSAPGPSTALAPADGRRRRRRRGRPSPRPRSTGPRRAGGVEPPHWAGGGLRGEHLRRPLRRRLRRLVRRRHRRRRVHATAGRAGRRGGRRRRARARDRVGGWPSRWPRGASRCTASTPPPPCSTGCAPSPAATRSRLTLGDMADLDLRRPAAVRGRVRGLQHLLQPRLGRGAAALPRAGRRAARARRALRARGLRARREHATRRPGRR